MPRRRRNTAPRDGGFTLIELLVTITILGILAAVAVISVKGLRTKSVTSACSTDVRSDVVALETYKTKYGKFPPPLGTTGADNLTASSEGVIKNLEESGSYKITYTATTPYDDYKLTVKVPETENALSPTSDILTKDSDKSAITTACTGP